MASRRLDTTIRLLEEYKMDNMYATYNLKEIKSIINQAVEREMWDTRDKRENWDTIKNLKTSLFDMFGIED